MLFDGKVVGLINPLTFVGIKCGEFVLTNSPQMCLLEIQEFEVKKFVFLNQYNLSILLIQLFGVNRLVFSVFFAKFLQGNSPINLRYRCNVGC